MDYVSLKIKQQLTVTITCGKCRIIDTSVTVTAGEMPPTLPDVLPAAWGWISGSLFTGRRNGWFGAPTITKLPLCPGCMSDVLAWWTPATSATDGVDGGAKEEPKAT